MKFVLSGGGARGFAHVGVLQAMQEHGITPDAISATSAGSIVGAFIADGYSPEEVKELLSKKVGLSILFQMDGLRSRMISLKRFGEFMEKNLRHQNLEELPMPFHVATTNFLDGTQRIFSSGSIVETVLAACSIPGLFPPVFFDQIPYVDGGLSNNLPVEPFENNKQEVIAVHVNPIAPFDKNISMVQMLDRTFHLSFANTVRRSAAGCYMFIEPPELHQFALFDVPKLSAVYDMGYHYTNQLLQEHKIFTQSNQSHPSP